MRVFYAIIFSALIHALIYWLTPDEPVGTQASEIPVEIAYVERALPVVDETEVPPEIEAEPDAPEDQTQAELWSKSRVRVQEQMRAQATGQTANRGTSAPRPPSSQRPDSRENRELPDVMKMAREHTAQGMNATAKLQQEGPFLEPGRSTLGQTVPDDIRVGSFSALNLDPYLHYSFITRLQQQIRHRWENGIVSTVGSLQNLDFRSTQTRWITHIEVELSHEGEFLNGRVIKESGLRGFDLAALRSFRDARYFPNPPKDFINEEDRIIIQYAFDVRWDPRRLVRRQ